MPTEIWNLGSIGAVAVGLLALYGTVRHARACNTAQATYLWRLLGQLKQGADPANLPASGECPALGNWDIVLGHGLSATLTLSPLGHFQATLWSRRLSWAWGGREWYGSTRGRWHFRDGCLSIPGKDVPAPVPGKDVPNLVVGVATEVTPDSFQLHTAAGSFIARRASPREP